MTKTPREREIFKKLFRESAVAWEETANRILPIFADAADLMAGNSWWLLPQFSARHYQTLLEDRAKITAESLTASIINWANKAGEDRLQRIVAGWSLSAFLERKAIFAEALWAHGQAKYFVSVPPLIAQAEGIVRTSLHVATKGAQQSYYFEKVRKEFARKLKTVAKLTKKQKVSTHHIRAVENYHNLAVVENVFASFNPASDPVPKTLNRHAIAHGISTDYGTLEQSTKTILFLDMLHALCAQVEETA